MAGLSDDERLLGEEEYELEYAGGDPTGSSYTVNSNGSGTKSFLQRNQLAVVCACLLVAVGATVGVLAASGSFESRPSESSSSSATPAGFQSVPEIVAHPMFSKMPAPQLSPGSEKGLKASRARWSFSGNEGRNTFVSYDVEHVENITIPELISDITGLKCSDDSLTVAMSSPAAATDVAKLVVPNTVLPMMDGWHCGEHIRKVTAAGVVDGSSVTFATVNITLQDVFKKAKIAIHTNYSNATETAAAAEIMGSIPREPVQGHPDRRERRGIFGFFHHVWDDVTHFVGGALAVGKAIVTGKLDLPDKTTTMWQFTFGPKACISSLSQDDAACSFHADVDTIVELDIDHWSLQSFKLAVEGNAHAEVNSNVDLSKSFSSKGSETAMDDKLWGGTIMIGAFPLPLSVYGQLILSHDFEIDPEFTFNADAQANGHVEYGIEFDHTSGWQWIKEHTFTKTANVNDFEARVEAHAGFGVTPILSLKAMYIGGPFVQATFEVDATAEIADGTEQTACNGGAQVDITGDLDVGIGAKLDIKIMGHQLFEHDWELSVYDSPEEQLYETCLKF
eukprot:m.477836 g.477836  ORF g.477836 m.477836 type:complete len:564 (+) comp20962_c0_seq1:311-2002(+)